MSSAVKLATLLTAAMLAAAACTASTVPAGPSESPSGSSTSAPTIVAARSAAPTTTLVAVLDGEPWIAYSWPRVATDGRWAIFVVRPDGSEAHEIAADVPGEHRRAAWSPDGKRLAFVVQDADHPDGSIWTANADGSGAALLSAGGTECPVGLFPPGVVAGRDEARGRLLPGR